MTITKNTGFNLLKFAVAFYLAFMTGCSSLPKMVPDMEVQARPVQVEGARGPLTVKQSRAIIKQLQERNKGETNIFDRHLAMEEAIVGSPLIVGNKVTLLIDGPTTYKAMFDAIEKAKDHINLETYIFDPDEIGKRFADALIAKQQSGVQVNIIYDSVGALNTPAEFFQRMRDSGIKVLEYNPVNPLKLRKGWDVNQRDHRKLMVIDGHTAFVGGINISGVYSSSSRSGSSLSSGGGSGSSSKGSGADKEDKDKKGIEGIPWRDTHIRIEGPVVSEFQKLFITTWENQKGEPLGSREYLPKQQNKGEQVVRAIGSTPLEPYSQMYVTLLSAINSAETSIFITNAYFVPDPQLKEALQDAAARGVDVKLILPGKTDSNLVWYASRSHYTDLLDGGVHIYERQDAMLHAKTAVIDGVWSTIGSTNLDWRSFLHNQELDAVVLGHDFGAQMMDMFAMDLQGSKEITLEQWKRRSLLDRMKEMGARIWARWL
ncbi:MAG TPA: phospholipase D-like domain-containing protein [Methylophilaceae bacterium]|nr:phospholipase D-like domain-containing protein [Methylophilaceae bacterium]